MKRLSTSLVLSFILLIVLCWSVWGQVAKTVAGQLQPFVFDISQAVPVQVTVPITGSNPVTMTLPLTVSVSLRVKVDAASKTAKVETLPAPTAVVAVATATPAPSTVSGDSGKPVEIDGVQWTLIEAKNLGQTLKGGFKNMTTEGKFIGVTFDVQNASNKTIAYMGINLVDGEGRTYKAMNESALYVKEQERCILEQINPGLKRRCTSIYEVPAQATGFKIEFTNLEMFNATTQQVSLNIK